MTQKSKRIIAVLLILCISIGGGIIINKVWTAIERKLYPIHFDTIISNASDEFDVPEYVIYSVIKVESNFDPDAVSNKGAIGLMQMMPSTFDWLTGDDHLAENITSRMLDDPEVSIRYGTYYLSYLYKKFGYDWDLAFIAYNAGEGNLKSWLDDPEYTDENGELSHIPIKETRNYIKKINDAMKNYKELYPDNTY